MKLFIWVFCLFGCFMRQAHIITNFLESLLLYSMHFRKMFLFSFQCIVSFPLISSLINWLFTGVLFILWVFVLFFPQCSFYGWLLASHHCDQTRCLVLFQSFKIYKDWFCGLLDNIPCVLKKNVYSVGNGLFYRYLLNPSVYFSFVFWLCHGACGTLLPQLGVELTPPALEVQRLYHWNPSA